MREVVQAAQELDATPSVRAIILTGAGDKAFAAGADIKEMQSQGYAQAYNQQILGGWEGLRTVRKPLIAAVNGYALGGGCEVAMLCDIIVASDKASFGQVCLGVCHAAAHCQAPQPEVALGVTPGMGGTQRLTWAVGKYKAMDMLLTGRRCVEMGCLRHVILLHSILAQEAEQIGLVSRVVPHEQLMEHTEALAKQVAGFSLPALTKIKDCVNAAMEMSLTQGVAYEKRLFWGCFALRDKAEGMSAFVEKRAPEWQDE